MIKELINEYINIKSESYDIQGEIIDLHTKNEAALKGCLDGLKKVKFLSTQQQPLTIIKILRQARKEVPEISSEIEDKLEVVILGR